MKRLCLGLGVAVIALTIGLNLLENGTAIGSPVSDEAAAAVVGGCNGPTAGTIYCDLTHACPGTCLLTSDGDFNTESGDAAVCTVIAGGVVSCLDQPTDNYSGCIQ